jgi:hypothetical protein
MFKLYVVTEEKLDAICARMEASQRKRLRRLAVPSGVSKCSADNATKLINVLLYKIKGPTGIPLDQQNMKQALQVGAGVGNQ